MERKHNAWELDRDFKRKNKTGRRFITDELEAAEVVRKNRGMVHEDLDDYGEDDEEFAMP